MSWQLPFTALLIAAMLAALASNRAGIDLVVLGVLAAFLVAGIITPAEAASGFGNTELITVAMLYVVATGLKQTGGMAVVTSRFLDRSRTTFQAQARLTVPVAALSAFMNNTPLVAMFMPVLGGLSRRTGIPASRLFMPLSFASILGGVCTLIGTSTNLVVNGLLKESNRAITLHNQLHPDQARQLLPEMGLWTMAWVGVPVCLAGVSYILLFGRKLLPENRSRELSPENARHYMTAMRVEPWGAVVDRTIEEAGLRHLPSLFLSRIDRGEKTLPAVEPDEVLGSARW